MQIDRKLAEEKAENYVKKVAVGSGMELVLVEKSTREEDFGWIFFYDSKQYLDTKDLRSSLVGNAPFIITREGQVHVTGTAFPVDHYIDLYLKYGSCHPE